MGVSKEETQVTWNTNASVTVTNATMVWSDAITFDAGDLVGGLTVSADTAGTPSAGDLTEVWVAYSTGDVLGNGDDDFSTPEHSFYMGPINNVAAETPGEDPGILPVPIDVASFKACKLGVKCPQAATHNVTVRARLHTRRFT